MPVRVVCDFCQTVYNIPDAKLVRDVSQATCKVCQNKIMIRRDPSAPAPGLPARQPATTPTVAGEGALATAAVPPGPFEGDQEQEISESWKEGLIDNRQTEQLLRKSPANSSAPGPAVATAPAFFAAPKGVTSGMAGSQGASGPDVNQRTAGKEKELTPGESIDFAVENSRRQERVNVVSSRPKTTGNVGFVANDDEGARAPSATVSLFSAMAAGVALTGLVVDGAWATGLFSVVATAGCAFALTATFLNGVLRRRGFLAIAAILFLAWIVASATVAGLILTGGERTRALSEQVPWLAPLTSRPVPPALAPLADP